MFHAACPSLMSCYNNLVVLVKCSLILYAQCLLYIIIYLSADVLFYIISSTGNVTKHNGFHNSNY